LFVRLNISSDFKKEKHVKSAVTQAKVSDKKYATAVAKGKTDAVAKRFTSGMLFVRVVANVA